MNKKRNNWRTRYFKVGLLLIFTVIIAIALLSLFLRLVETPAIEPVLSQIYLPPASLQDHLAYKNGFIPAEALQRYSTAFTNDDNYEDAFPELIEFQQGLNGIKLSDALNIDRGMANSLSKAITEVKKTVEKSKKEKNACDNFNALLNPSLLVMDLTLWTGKSQIYLTLQQHRDIGIRCEFYFPQLKHGMLVYDPYTGRMVQRNVFCDPSEPKSKCFGVWNYFWRYALEPVNYGAGCTMTDWMQQGFICVNGIDLRTEPESRLMSNFLERGVEGQLLGIVEANVKEEFQNALGVSGKSIIDNVKQKCSKIKEKTSKYENVLSALSAGSSLTGGVVSAEIDGSSNIEEEYEKAMLFASLFSEACLLSPAEFAKDLAGGGGAGQFGLNDPAECLLDDVPVQTGLQAEVGCIQNFFGSQGLDKVLTIDGLPDSRCLPSVSQSSPSCTTVDCLVPKKPKDCGSDGTKCGREPTKQEDKYLKNAGAGKAGEKWRVVDTREEMDAVCPREGGDSTAAACSVQRTKIVYISKENIKQNPNEPTTARKLGDKTLRYTFKALVKHEQNHLIKDDLTKKTDRENEDDRKDEDGRDSNNFVKPKQKDPTPEGLEPDECSAQAQKVEAMADCLDKAQFSGFVHKPTGFAPGTKGPTPDPNPIEEGKSVPTCSEAAQPNEGAGYFGTLVGAADQCLIGDFCDFGAFGGSFRAGIPKECWFVENSEEGNKCNKLR